MWGLPQRSQPGCEEPGCERKADPRYRCWKCERRFCRTHALELLDEPPPKKILCLGGIRSVLKKEKPSHDRARSALCWVRGAL